MTVGSPFPGYPPLPGTGVTDKRKLVVESEFAGVLRVLQREGNKLSAIVRDAWDTGSLNILTKTDPMKATDAHISIIGHITKTELLKYLSQVELFNGFGNRFLWVTTKRSKLLPFGGCPPQEKLQAFQVKLVSAVRFSQSQRELTLSEDARAYWAEIYHTLSKEKYGLVGTLIARAEPIILRLSLIYALLDQSTDISLDQLKSAYDTWKYCERSCEEIFGRSTGNIVADKILGGLSEAEYGLSQTQISETIFKKNQSAADISEALKDLEHHGMLCKIAEMSELGRARTRWVLIKQPDHTKHEINEFNEVSALTS